MITQETVQVCYRTEDGWKFDTLEEAQEHEAQLSELKRITAYRMRQGEYIKMDSLDENPYCCMAELIKIPDDNALEALKYFRECFGYCFDGITIPGCYVYAGGLNPDTWVDITAEIERLNGLLELLNKTEA